jgi:hypothetical protein
MTSALTEGVMDRHFYLLKAGVLTLAIVAAGITTGFQMDKLSAHLDNVHYNASIYADAQTHRVTHAFSHAVSALMDHLRGR